MSQRISGVPDTLVWMAPANPVVKPASDAAASTACNFESVYTAYFGFVWRCMRGLGVAEAALDDAAQDVFVVVHRRLHDFRGESTLRTWLYGIIRNVASNQRRSQRRRPEAASPELELPSLAPGPHEQLVEREHAAFVQTFLAALDEPKRELFVLVLLEELSVTEVAEMLQIPVNTAYTRLRSLRLAFQRALHVERPEQP